MKKVIITIGIAVFITFNIAAQDGVAINTTSAAADASAMLDISSNDKGVLIPRMSESERLGISGPARGLMVYQIGSNEGFWYYNGLTWLQFGDNLGNHTATDSLNMSNNKIVNVTTCTQNLDAANKEYVDNAVAAGGGSDMPTMISNESSTTMKYGPALRYCNGLSESGFSDWHLPSYDELTYVISKGGTIVSNPTSTNYIWIRNIGFNNGYSSQLQRIRLSDGYTEPIDAFNYNCNVRCVR